MATIKNQNPFRRVLGTLFSHRCRLCATAPPVWRTEAGWEESLRCRYRQRGHYDETLQRRPTPLIGWKIPGGPPHCTKCSVRSSSDASNSQLLMELHGEACGVHGCGSQKHRRPSPDCESWQVERGDLSSRSALASYRRRTARFSAFTGDPNAAREVCRCVRRRPCIGGALPLTTSSGNVSK